MSVYFIAEDESGDYDNLRIKIGISDNISQRIRQLSTGIPYKLKLMGIICLSSDGILEAKLHEKYNLNRTHGEWFNLSVSDVLEELKLHAMISYLEVNEDAFDVASYDIDGIPEIVGAWQWSDIEYEEFCPSCGWGGGPSYNENYGGERCLECGFTVPQ